MKRLSLKASHRVIAAYYASLAQFDNLEIKHEGAVRSAFQTLLDYCAKQVGRVLVPEYRIKRKGTRPVIADGAILDQFTKAFNLGVWEAKDTDDDLEKEIKAKFAAGYPRENILFQTPHRAVLYQAGQRLYDADLTRPENLVHVLDLFFDFRPSVIDEWEKAADEFKERVPELGRSIAKLIHKERQTNLEFKAAFISFLSLCRASLNPNLSEEAVEEMIVQHLLTERIFRKVFISDEFMRRNVIAVEIEKVIRALVAKKFKRDDFTRGLEHFYIAIERAAETINDFSEKQKFLNTVYERFFQGFSVKVADTHGIVYTPEPIVTFMIASVEQVLREHFETGLAEKNVHILDPFTGTGNYIVHIMERMPPSAMKYKYREELYCNEVMLLPYYVASMNIEHLFFEKIGSYEPFEGICLVDTFETAEKEQGELFSMTEENTARVKRQRKAPIKVIIANPPYNAGQLNENDNNKNRRYEEIDGRVKRTYSQDSDATLVRKLNDPYVKAIRFASDRIGDVGIVCYVNNNSFVTEKSFDGMRKHLEQDFDLIYILDLGGNVRKHPTLSGTTHNVFGIQVGVSINLFVRLPRESSVGRRAKIHYSAVPVDWRKGEKYDFLEKNESITGLDWKVLTPDKKHHWITNENDDEFANFIPLGSKESKASAGLTGDTIFRTYSLGVSTNRDSVVYDFDPEKLAVRCEQFADDFNAEIERWKKKAKPPKESKKLQQYVDMFVSYEKLKWSETLKKRLVEQAEVIFKANRIRKSLYRPFTTMVLYFDPTFIDRVGSVDEFFPNEKAERENIAIAVNLSPERPFCPIAVNHIPSKDVSGGFGSPSYCFPLYTYSEDGRERHDNIPHTMLDQFVRYYEDETITRPAIFYYVYGVLHHPGYRVRFTDNLKQELPRIPMVDTAEDFHAFSDAGRKLVELHVHFEKQNEWKLKRTESQESQLDWRVEAMKLTKDGKMLVYNEHFTFTGIPFEAYQYLLGNRSALDWLIDQYRVTRDAEGNIISDPNRDDDEQYIVRLVGQIVTVSVETMKIVKGLQELRLP